MFSPTMSTSWSLLPPIIINSTPAFSPLSTFVCGFWNNFYYFKKSTREIARFQFFSSYSASKYLNALSRLMYHKKSFVNDLTRPYLGQCDFMLRLKLFLKKWVSRSSFLEDYLKVIMKKTVIVRRRRYQQLYQELWCQQ